MKLPASTYAELSLPKRTVLEEKPDLNKSFVEGHLREHIDCNRCEDEDGEESFFIADMSEVYRQYVRWTRNLPRVKPFYAVKVNPDPEVLRLLASLGTGFDCSSRSEIEQVLNLGVGCDRIIYANPCKARSHLHYAQRVGIRRMTFDSTDELYKIKSIVPEAELLLRIVTDDSSSRCRFSHKFGAPLKSVKRLLELASELDLKIVGVSFHVGSGARDPQLFAQATRDSRAVFDCARSLGHSPNVLDVGGGFSTESFEVMSQTLAIALDESFPGQEVELISEPGRYFVEYAFTLACNIIARREVREEASSPYYMLFLNDGVYHNFMDSLLSHLPRKPEVLLSSAEQASTVAIPYSIWGPTCDGVDQILESVSFYKILDIGDWLYFEGMGAYTSCLSTSFNGFLNRRIVHYVSSEPVARALLHY